MKSRSQKLRRKEKNFDPLVIEDFDWNNEWADSSHVPLKVLMGVSVILLEPC